MVWKQALIDIGQIRIGKQNIRLQARAICKKKFEPLTFRDAAAWQRAVLSLWRGARFRERVFTEIEQARSDRRRERAASYAKRWAAKEAVSKVLGLGVRGVGWRDIEIVRLPTGQPTVRLHGRAAARAEQLGMARVAVSISHEGDYAVAIAFGVRSAGGAYVFPLDIEARLDDRERAIMARMERLRELDANSRG